MRLNGWLLIDRDGGSPYNFPLEPLTSSMFGVHSLSQITSFVDNSLHHSRYLFDPGVLAIREAFSCISKFAGALLFWVACGSHLNINGKLSGYSHVSNHRGCSSSMQVKHITTTEHNHLGFHCQYRQRGKSSIHVMFHKISSFAMGQLSKEGKQLQSFPILSLAAALVPPFDLPPKVLAGPLDDNVIESQRCVNQNPCEIEGRGCDDLSFSNLYWRNHAIEPRTGIEFPTILDGIFSGRNTSISEVLVGTGSRIMTIIRIKSLKVYAFGFYVCPTDICEKLGPKYTSLSVGELNKHQDFYKDLLREDINMTVRLVVSCSGVKVNTVKDAFEKSLRNRLAKMNPETDYHCIRTFGSLFSQDIPLHKGTTIDFRRTADGHLITEIEGDQIGAVHSKDLCRAFFDMYIGDIPVCEHTKEEIGRNVVSIIRRC